MSDEVTATTAAACPRRAPVRESVRLLAGAQKTSRGVPAYTLHVNRPVGRVLAALAHQARMTPDQVTTVSAVLSVLGCAVLVSGPPSAARAVGAALLLALGYAFDSADGQLARLRGGGSAAGEWFDHVVDAGKTVLVHGSVLVWASERTDADRWLLLLPLAFLLVGVVTFSSTLLVDLLRRAAGAPRAGGPGGRWGAWVKLPVDFGVLCLVLALAATPLFWWAYGALLVAGAGYLALHLRRARGELA